MSLVRSLYRAAAGAASACLGPVRLLRGEMGASWDAEYAERLGDAGGEGPVDLWMQASSVGEVRGSLPVLDAVRSRRPGAALLLTATTRTGREQARQAAGRIGAASGYFPFDFPGAVRRRLDRTRPAMIALFETEIWPELIATAAERGIRVAIVNGRISDESLPRYRLVRPLIRETLARLDLVAARTPLDAERFAGLGARADRITVTGDVKFDLPPPPDAGDVARFRDGFGLENGAPLLVAGSTADGEDPLVLEAFRATLRTAPSARLLLAPRHPERFDSAAESARSAAFTVRRRSAGETMPVPPGGVIVLDTIGELRLAYGAARAAFVGGSLVSSGGQNLLEPASAGLAPITGPDNSNFREAAARLEAADALIRVRNAVELGSAWAHALSDPQAAHARGERARGVVALGAGAGARSADLLLRLLDAPRGAVRS